MFRAFLLIVLIVSFGALAACGNKGNLYLPTPTPAPAKKTDKPDSQPAKPTDASTPTH
jgi:predicted small lipoprotein YifL